MPIGNSSRLFSNSFKVGLNAPKVSFCIYLLTDCNKKYFKLGTEYLVETEGPPLPKKDPPNKKGQEINSEVVLSVSPTKQEERIV